MPKKGNPLAKCRGIEISPQDATIDIGTLQSYSCEAFDKKGNSLGDITTLVQFTISRSAGGSWNRNVYTSENVGKWQITASYKGKLATAMLEVLPLPEPLEPEPPMPTPESEPPVPEPPLPEPLPPPLLPESFEGRLFLSLGHMIGEYEDIIAFPYQNYPAYEIYLRVITNGEGRSFLLPNSDGINSGYVSAVMTARDEIWIAFNIPITINQYYIGDDSVTLVSSTTLGDSKSRLKDLIRLDNGKLFVAWHQQERGNEGIDVSFAYRTLDGNWHTLPYTWVFPFTIPATHAAVCQHPDDGSIWFFCQPDGGVTICVIHLVEIDGEILVDWTDYDFLNKYDGTMAPEVEIPFFSAIADKERNAIILAYQSNDWQFFSIDPFCKGAKPAVIQVNSDASKSLLFVLDKWVERRNPLYVGLNDQNEVWLTYGKIDEVNLTWNDLYISTQNKDQYCGKLQYGIPGNQGVRLCNSSRLVVAIMDDGYIHFFSVD